MLTDPAPRGAKRRAEYERSDRLGFRPIVESPGLVAATRDLFGAVGAVGTPSVVRRAGQAVLGEACDIFGVAPPELAVLGVRPHRVRGGVCVYELFGDYTRETGRVRVWLRTAIKKKVSSPRAFLATLLHELGHHLDCTAFDLPETIHTRGFFHRTDALYHHVLGTPERERRPLRWIPMGSRYRVDWTGFRRTASVGVEGIEPSTSTV